jgi:phosphohistidine phosphatase
MGKVAMELYIVRHGDAVDPITGGYARDADRPLTSAGAQEVEAAGAGLARLGVAIDRLLTSPLVRARQTADLLAPLVARGQSPVACLALAPGGQLAEVLEALQGGRRVMVVGHNPSLGELAGWLAFGDPLATVPLRTAGVCRVDLAAGAAPGQGDLRWLLPPKLVARLV